MPIARDCTLILHAHVQKNFLIKSVCLQHVFSLCICMILVSSLHDNSSCPRVLIKSAVLPLFPIMLPVCNSFTCNSSCVINRYKDFFVSNIPRTLSVNHWIKYTYILLALIMSINYILLEFKIQNQIKKIINIFKT